MKIEKLYIVSEENLGRMAGAAYSHGEHRKNPLCKKESYDRQRECKEIEINTDTALVSESMIALKALKHEGRQLTWDEVNSLLDHCIELIKIKRGEKTSRRANQSPPGGRVEPQIDLEKTKQVSLSQLIRAGEKTWLEMPFVQIVVREKMFKELVTRMAFHLGYIDTLFEQDAEK